MGEELILKMREALEQGKELGKVSTLEEAFAEHPPEWCIIDNRLVHV